MKSDPILLILDIDETLIHATSNQLKIAHDFEVFKYYVYKRPHVDTFLQYCFQTFKVAFWSSASDDYVNEIVLELTKNIIEKPEFIWGRSRCTARREDLINEYGYYTSDGFVHYLYTKQLNKLKKKGFDLERVLIVDDTPSKVANNYGNAIYIDEFIGDTEDKSLLNLIEYLDTLKNCERVRKIEKRGWNNKNLLLR